MKPASLATLLIRFTSIYLIIYSIFSSIVPIITASVFSGANQMQSFGFVSGLFRLQMVVVVGTIIVAILLYIWSGALGRLIAKGLD